VTLESDLVAPSDPWEIVASSKYFRLLLGVRSKNSKQRPNSSSKVDCVIQELARTVK
jgi:hypothetical protein